jgi:hypothetical protein
VVTENEIELRPAQTNPDGGWAARAPLESGWAAVLENGRISGAL